MVKITYTISDDFLTVSPKHRQAAGVMGQAQACTVTFKVPLGVTYWHKRIEFVDTTGKLFTTDEEGYNELLKYENGEASVTLPWQWTVYGGTAFVRFVAYNVDADGNITEKVSTPDRALLFENSNTGDDTVERRSLSQLILDGHSAIKDTNEVYEEVKEAYESGKFIGETGATPKITIGTVTSLPSNYAPTAGIDNSDPKNPVLSFGIPKGGKGDKPVKGEDYFTETDKQEIYNELLPEAAQAAVHIGSEQPTDPNTKMWINPNGEAVVALLCSQAQKLTDEQKAQAKANLGLEDGGNDIVIDEALSLDSVNPVQNKVITAAINSAMLKGTDPITDIANDTPYYWSQLGTGVFDITPAGSANIIGGNSAFYLGSLLNLVGTYYVVQLVVAPISQNIYVRSASSKTAISWMNTWKPLSYTKQELVQGVLDALPTWEGGAY